MGAQLVTLYRIALYTGNADVPADNELRLEMRRHFFAESSQTLERVARGGGGVTVPEDV